MAPDNEGSAARRSGRWGAGTAGASPTAEVAVSDTGSMDGSMVRRLLAALLPEVSASASGARCLGSSVMGVKLAAATPMSGRTMGRRCEAGAASPPSGDTGTGAPAGCTEGAPCADWSSMRPLSPIGAAVTSTRFAVRFTSPRSSSFSAWAFAGSRNEGMGTSPMGGTSPRRSSLTSIGGIAHVAPVSGASVPS